MRARLTVPVAVLASVAATAAVVACSSTTTEPGELVVAVDTNVPLPGYVTSFQLQVVEDGAQRYLANFDVGPSADLTRLPATLGVISSGKAGEIVQIKLVGLSEDMLGNATAVALRSVTTTVPSSGTSLLRIPIDALCFGDVSVLSNATASTDVTAPLSAGGASAAVPQCALGETCIAGGCASSSVDSTKLPTFLASGAFGGDGGGTCFPTASCFDQAPADERGFEPVAADCTIALPTVVGSGGANVPVDPSHLNVAVPLPAVDCGSSTTSCIAPLDSVAATETPQDGFYVDAASGRVHLPPGLCSPTTAGGATHAEVLVSTACAAKTVDHPLCGDWTSVSTVEDASIASGAALGASSGGGEPVPGTIAADGAVDLGADSDGGGSDAAGSATTDGAAGEPGDAGVTSTDGSAPVDDGGTTEPREDAGLLDGSMSEPLP